MYIYTGGTCGSSRDGEIDVAHYDDVMMEAIASQITSLASVYSTVQLGADQRKHQSSASLAFVRGIHRGPVKSPHKWPVTRKMFPFDDIIMSEYRFNSYESMHGCRCLVDARRQAVNSNGFDHIGLTVPKVTCLLWGRVSTNAIFMCRKTRMPIYFVLVTFKTLSAWISFFLWNLAWHIFKNSK